MLVNFRDLLHDMTSDENQRILPDSVPTEAHKKDVLEKYVKYVNDQNFEGIQSLLADDFTGYDPVGSELLTMETLSKLSNVSWKVVKCVQTGPVRTTFGNEAAVPFSLYAVAGGHAIVIDIIDVMTFNEEGKIVQNKAYWGRENVTLIN